MPREFITDSNYSLLVLTVSWFTCAIAILGTVARAIAKIVFRRAFSLDDYSSSLSIVSSAKNPPVRNLIRAIGCVLASRHCSNRCRYDQDLEWIGETRRYVSYIASLCLSEGDPQRYYWIPLRR